MIRVFLADHQDLFREGLKEILSKNQDIQVTGEAGTGEKTLIKTLNNDYDVILIDISLPDINWLDLLNQIKEVKTHSKIIILNMHSEEQNVFQVYKAGAAGYFSKESSKDEFLKAIRKVAAGGRYVAPTVAEELVTNISVGDDQSLHDKLSTREYQVMMMIASGKAVKDIARELERSPSTVSTLRRRILTKMKMKNSAELMKYVIKGMKK
jgi:DNA-binding NarL/FixJ family response regulator